MILTAEEIKEGAKRLAKSSLNKSWDDLSATERAGFAMVVVNLAAAGPLAEVKHSPEAVHVFLAWMGDPLTCR